jgi:hypothetical protein
MELLDNIYLLTLIDDLQSLSPWGIFSVGLGTATIIILIIYLVVFINYRNKKLKVHELRINFDGGVFQGSKEELVFKAKLGADIDISRIRPAKDGFSFNGYNVYKRFVSSTIKDDGISKSLVTSEELDGIDKNVIIMPDYDLYLVAKYSELGDRQPVGLKDEYYYSDYLSFEDLVSDLKHLNFDKENYPDKINLRHSDKAPGFVFVFRDKTICAIIQPYKCISKVYLRTSDFADSKLLTPFYQSEDINDAMNWYSFAVIYNTKPERFIRSFKDSYDDADVSLPTTDIEFDLILGSLSSFADPVMDRAVLLVERYEKDRLLENPPRYVLSRELPDELDENGNLKADNPLAEEIKAVEKEPVKEEKAPEEVKKEEDKPAAETQEETKPEPVAPAEIKPAPDVKEEPKAEEAPKAEEKPSAPLAAEKALPSEDAEKNQEEVKIPVQVPSTPKPVEAKKVQAEIVPTPVEEEEETPSPVEEMPEAEEDDPRKHIRPIRIRKKSEPAPAPAAKKKQPLPFIKLRPKFMSVLTKKPEKPIDGKLVSAEEAGLPISENVNPTPAPILPSTKKKRRRQHRKNAAPKNIFLNPSIQGERRLPSANKPRRKDVPIARQIKKNNKKKHQH